MTITAWLLMTLGFIAAGLGGVKLRGRIESRRLDREFPEKRS